jgi:WD40 repeat protein
MAGNVSTVSAVASVVAEDPVLLFENQADASVCCVAFSSTGSQIATGGLDHRVRLYSGDEANVLQHVGEGHTDRVWALDFSPNGLQLASGGRDRLIFLWETRVRASLIIFIFLIF